MILLSAYLYRMLGKVESVLGVAIPIRHDLADNVNVQPLPILLAPDKPQGDCDDPDKDIDRQPAVQVSRYDLALP